MPNRANPSAPSTTSAGGGGARPRRVVPVVPVVAGLIAGFVPAWFGSEFLLGQWTNGAVLWLAVAAGVTLLVLLRQSQWPAAVLGLGAGVTGANVLSGTPFPVAVAFAVANCLESLVAAGLFSQLTHVPARRDDPGSPLIRRWVDAALLGVACAAGVAAGVIALAGGLALATPHVSLLTLRGYILSHLAGLLVAAPVLLSLPRSRAGWRELVASRRPNVEWALLTVVGVGLTLWLFASAGGLWVLPLVAVVVLSAGFRLDPFRAMATVTPLCLLAASRTVDGAGPMETIDDPRVRVLVMQAGLALVCVVTLLVTVESTLRRNAAAQVRDAQRLVNVAFDAAPTGMFIASLAPGREGEILSVNASLCALLHRTPGELIGRHVSVLAEPEDGPLAQAHIDRMLAGTRHTDQRERILLRSDGTRIPTSQAINLIQPERGAPYAVAQLTDLRDRIEAERAMADALDAEARAVVQLRAVNEARVAAGARLAHDLRNPLSSVRAYQELLAAEAHGEWTPDQVQMLTIAQQNTDRVIRLVDDLVRTASLELDQIEAVNRVPAPLQPIVDAALESVAPLCRQRGQTLDRPPEPTDVEIFADAAQVERALVNVLSNAVKYTPDGGRIGLTVRADDDCVELAVIDTGIGVPEEQIDQLGSQFFRADTAREHGISGIGLGLAVVKAVLAKHDGRLTVTSTPGAGSTFTLHLPVAVPKRRAV